MLIAAGIVLLVLGLSLVASSVRTVHTPGRHRA